MKALLTAPALALALVASGTAFAQEAELLRCGELTGRDERLACFDTLTAKVSAARKAGETPAAKAEVFGIESQQRKSDVEAIQSNIAGLFQGWGPNQVIRLSNGQSWQIADDSSVVLYLQSPKVSVRRGTMSTFVLELEGTKMTARVRRLP